MIQKIPLFKIFFVSLVKIIKNKMFEAIIYLLQGKNEENERYKQ